MDGWRKTEDRIVKSQSKVSQECYVQASRPGLDQGLCRHHRAQVEGVEGPMGDVPQVLARKGGMPAPRTRLQHLVDSEVLLKKKRWSDTTSFPSSRGQEQAVRYPRAGRHVISSSGARRRQCLRYLLLATPCGDKTAHSTDNVQQCGQGNA